MSRVTATTGIATDIAATDDDDDIVAAEKSALYA